MKTQQFTNRDTKFNPNGPVRVDAVTIKWIADDSPDLSWLDQSDADMGEGFEKQSAERKASYGDAWIMQGCVAKAEVSRPIGGGARRIETLSSGGLWGIESDSEASYKTEVEGEQLADLVDHLSAFGIETDVEELRALIQ